jgi:hypothetical protein
MKTAVEDHELERLWVVYPGKAAYSLTGWTTGRSTRIMEIRLF